MKVRVTRGKGWYKDKVGELFEVYEVGEDPLLGAVYYIDPPEYSAPKMGGRRLMTAGNCVVVEEDTKQGDAVEHPDHYTRGRFEVIEVIEQVTSGYKDGFVAHCVGTATKYQHRAPFKHASPLEDLRKAAKYLEFAIAYLEQQGEAE